MGIRPPVTNFELTKIENLCNKLWNTINVKGVVFVFDHLRKHVT